MVTKKCMNSGGRSSAGFDWKIGRMREIGRLGGRGRPEGGCFCQEGLLGVPPVLKGEGLIHF